MSFRRLRPALVVLVLLVFGVLLLSRGHANPITAGGAVWQNSAANDADRPKIPIESIYESEETWRDFQVRPGGFLAKQRPVQKPLGDFEYTGEYLQQTLVADYPESAAVKDVYLMVDTATDRFWNKMPVHTWTTFTRLPNFGIYSDRPGSLAGFPVYDAFGDMPRSATLDGSADLRAYLARLEQRKRRWNVGSDNIVEPRLDLSLVNFGAVKHLLMLYHAWQTRVDAKWFVIMRDDGFLFMGELMDMLSRLNPNTRHYFGMKQQAHHLDSDIVFAPLNATIVLSRALVRALFDPALGDNTQGDTAPTHRNVSSAAAKEVFSRYAELAENSTLGADAVLGLAIRDEANYTASLGEQNVLIGRRLQPYPLRAFPFSLEKWCEPVVSWGNLSPSGIETLWEYERLKVLNDSRITQWDLYHDFALPYLEKVRDDWMLESFDKVWVGDPDEKGVEWRDRFNKDVRKKPTVKPETSAELCGYACERNKDCFAWSHRQSFCGLQLKRFTLGEAHNHWTQYSSAEATKTGWMIDRVREKRVFKICDTLDFNELSGMYTDIQGLSEGWWFDDDLRAKFKTGFRN